MNEASRTISKCCDVQQVSNGETWQSIDDDRFTQVIATLGCEYCEWTEEAVNLAIDSGYVSLTTSSMCMEINAITEMLEWVRHQAITRLVCLTDSMSTLVKISTGMLHADWTTAISQSSLQSVSWIFCPGHSCVRSNERADALVDQATTESSLTLDPATMLSLVCEHIEAVRVDTSNTTLSLSLKE